MRGPAIALVIVVAFVALGGYTSYRVAQHLFGWSQVAPNREPFRVEIEEATVSRVDVDESKVELMGDLLGMFGATLVVTPNTEIQLSGTPVELKDLPRGARVRAAYEWKDGFKIARLIAADAPGKEPLTR
jgi:hypothetical protein